MRYKLTLSLLSALFFILSCSKTNDADDNNVGPCLPLTLLTRVSGTTTLGDTGGSRTVDMIFSYDEGNHLIRIKDGQKTAKFTYYSGPGYLVEYLDSTTSVIKKQVLQLQEFAPFEKPLKVLESHYEGDQLVFQSTNKYTYVNDLISNVQRTSGNTVVIQQYTFKNGNIATFDNGSGTIYSYKYDNKRNPFADRFLKFNMGPIDFASENSPTEIEENVNGVKKISIRVYTYNQNGYPTRVRSVSSDGTVILDYKFEYGIFPVGCY
ncbi:MAG: hypothetical protein V4594_01565 [Bacteroidota bacterium]